LPPQFLVHPAPVSTVLLLVVPMSIFTSEVFIFSIALFVPLRAVAAWYYSSFSGVGDSVRHDFQVAEATNAAPGIGSRLLGIGLRGSRRNV